MAINKSNTSPMMKAVLIILILVFVLGFVSIGTIGLFTSTGTDATTQNGQTGDVVSIINGKYQATVTALNQSLQSSPESYTVLVNLGNTYFDWASAMQEASKTTTSAAGADQPLWVSAKDAYGRAVALNNAESPVRVDYAITLYYSGETSKAIEVAKGVTKDDPKFPSAWFNLGIFKQSAGDNAAALAAYQQAVKLDPKGEQIGLSYAQQQITALKSAQSGSGATTSSP